jgi:hypothetical protein
LQQNKFKSFKQLKNDMHLGIIMNMTGGYSPNKREVKGKYSSHKKDDVRCDLGIDVGVPDNERYSPELCQAWKQVQGYAREELGKEATLILMGDERGMPIRKCSLYVEAKSSVYCPGCQAYREKSTLPNGTKKSTPKNPRLGTPEGLKFGDRSDLPSPVPL